MLVVDASAALQAAGSRDGFAALGQHELVAPPLMWSEAMSVLRETLWRGAAGSDLVLATRDRLLSAPVERRTSEALYIEAWRVAERLGWAKTYDAEYIALALSLNSPLLTIDERLRRGAGHIIEIIGRADL